jgi:hypothetical protein
MGEYLMGLQNLSKVLRYAALLSISILISVRAATAQLDAHLTLPTDYSGEVASAWFDLQMHLVKETPGFSPTVASRAFGYAGVTLYESIVPGMSGYRTLAGQLNALGELPAPSADVDYHWEIVANSALATITRHLFAHASDENKARIAALEQEFAERLEGETDPDVFARSVTQGRVVADAIFIWSLSDGGYNGDLTSFDQDYVPPSGAGLWLPTPRTDADPQPALQPYWGNNRPFILSSGDECAPLAPPEYSEEPASAFYTEALEVYETSQNLTPEQIEIANYWADNPGQTATPPGHSISITSQILRGQQASLALAAESYARVGIALADSFIACWHVKYQYNLLRPITYIQSAINPDWTPLITTPPFPEYPSGHSVQSAATAEVLTDLFGENFAFVDQTYELRGFTSRRFASFSGFSEEAAISRLYGGIHYRSAIEQGLEQGRCIGRRVSSLEFRQIA